MEHDPVEILLSLGRAGGELSVLRLIKNSTHTVCVGCDAQKTAGGKTLAVQIKHVEAEGESAACYRIDARCSICQRSFSARITAAQWTETEPYER